MMHHVISQHNTCHAANYSNSQHRVTVSACSSVSADESSSSVPIAVRAAKSLEVLPRCDAVVDQSFPFVHRPRQLADMPPPDTCIAPNPKLVRPLVTIVRGMPLRGNFWCIHGQRDAWAYHTPRGEWAAGCLTLTAAIAVLCSDSPFLGMLASRRRTLAVVAHPNRLLRTAAGDFVKMMCSFLVGGSCAISSGCSTLNRPRFETFLTLLSFSHLGQPLPQDLWVIVAVHEPCCLQYLDTFLPELRLMCSGSNPGLPAQSHCATRSRRFAASELHLQMRCPAQTGQPAGLPAFVRVKILASHSCTLPHDEQGVGHSLAALNEDPAVKSSGLLHRSWWGATNGQVLGASLPKRPSCAVYI